MQKHAQLKSELYYLDININIQLKMDVQDFSKNPEFSESYKAANCLNQVNLDIPAQNALGDDGSLASLMQSYVSTMSQSTTQLITILGNRECDKDITIDGAKVTPAEQKLLLEDIASKNNLLSRQLEKSLQLQINSNKGINEEATSHLINIPPKNWGTEIKVNDTSLKMIQAFSGDSTDNENELVEFLRSIFTLAQTSSLAENTAINVLLRKLNGTAHILMSQFISENGGPETLTMEKIVSQLETKFLQHCSALSADQQLYNLRIGSNTYSQLQAKIQKLARLATRLEKLEDREKLTRVKEISSFLMAISNADRLHIHGENSRRGQNNLQPLTLDMMANNLIKLSADKVSYRDPERMHQIVELPDVENKISQIRDNNAQRGATFRGNRNHNKTVGQRGGHPTYGRGGYSQDKAGNRQERGGYTRGFQRGAPFRGNNNRGQFGRRQEEQKQRPFVTTIMANVPPHACILCGAGDHTFKQDACPYHSCELQQTPCKYCNFGCHPHASCLSRENANQTWPNTKRM